jgi:hypothetical protein
MAEEGYTCWKCEKPIAPAEVYVSMTWWVGFESPSQKKTLLRDVIYRYCYRCATTLDLENTRLFDLEQPRFQLEGAVTLPEPKVLSRCTRCREDILTGHAYGHLFTALMHYGEKGEDVLSEIFSWKYCEKCAPGLDVDNIFILEAERPVDLLAVAKRREGPRGGS